MSVTLPLLRTALRDATRGWWMPGLTLGLAAAGELLIRFGGGGATTLVSLLDVSLLVTPLAALVVGTMQVHNAREATALMLAQPVARGRLFAGLYLGTLVPLAAALVLGLAAPFAWHGLLAGTTGAQLLALCGATVALAASGTALAWVIALAADDRVRALGLALAAWLGAAVLWDGLVLLLAMLLGDRPVTVPMLALLALNPIDVARVLLLVGTDAAGLIGYTGAVLDRALGAAAGRAVLVATLALWTLGPCWLARRAFLRKDF